MNTVKRYARAERVEELLRPPRYGACPVDAYRDLIRRRLAEKVPVTRILAEVREQGCTGSANLLVRYINQGRADPERRLIVDATVEGPDGAKLSADQHDSHTLDG